MRIERVEGLLVGSEVVGTNLVVRVTTDTGITGLGQSGAWGFPEATNSVIDHFRSALVGADPMRTEHLQQHLSRLRPFRGNILWGALSALDIALWDIKGQHLGVPVWELLGGRVRDKVRLHALILDSDVDAVARAARAAAEEGFTAIKYDPIPAGWQDMSLARIVESVRAMGAAGREAVGLDVDIIFELHRKLTPMHSLAVAEALAEFRPLFIEDPIQIDSVMIQGALAQRYGVPLANGERLSTIWEFRDLFASGGPQYVRPDLGLAGGFTGCRKIAAIAEAHHAALVSHNYMGPLLTAASIHLDVAIPNVITQEYLLQDESDFPGDAAFRTSLRRVAGYIEAPEAPGLGVELDEALLAAAPPRALPTTGVLRADGSPAFAS
jgi:galactonate dehydratase